jgi:hypothetical protein
MSKNKLPSMHDLGLKHHLDKAYEHEYTLDFYPEHLEDIRMSATLAIEIGIWNGNSLRMWADYFPNAQLIGADIEFSRIKSPMPRCSLRYADQSKKEDLEIAFYDVAKGSVDLIVEDGMHTSRCQQSCFGFMFDYVKPGGRYIIEDLQTSIIWPQEQGERVTTLDLVQSFRANGKLDSDYIEAGTLRKLEQQIERIELYTRTPDFEKSVSAVVFKKS